MTGGKKAVNTVNTDIWPHYNPLSGFSSSAWEWSVVYSWCPGTSPRSLPAGWCLNITTNSSCPCYSKLQNKMGNLWRLRHCWPWRDGIPRRAVRWRVLSDQSSPRCSRGPRWCWQSVWWFSGLSQPSATTASHSPCPVWGTTPSSTTHWRLLLRFLPTSSLPSSWTGLEDGLCSCWASYWPASAAWVLASPPPCLPSRRPSLCWVSSAPPPVSPSPTWWRLSWCRPVWGPQPWVSALWWPGLEPSSLLSWLSSSPLYHQYQTFISTSSPSSPSSAASSP